MNRIINRIALLLCIVIYTQCQPKYDNAAEYGLEANEPAMATDEVFEDAEDVQTKSAPELVDGKNSTSTSLPDKKKLIKEGNVNVRTSDIIKSKQQLDALCTQYKAYYEHEHTSNENRRIVQNLTIRIPAAAFEMFIKELEAFDSEIESKSIQSRDVTEAFYDTESRLQSKKVVLQRYRELLVKAKNVKEILEVEEKLRVLQEEIESTEGRLRYLSDQIAYSTLQLYMYQPKDFVYKPTPKDSFWERVKNALNSGWEAAIAFTLVLISVWPLLFVLPIVVGLYIRFRRRNSKSK